MKKIAIFSILFLCASIASADNYAGRIYEITVINITKGQSFTPILAATHKRGIQLFELGDVSSDELATLAESGNVAPLKMLLDESELVKDTVNTSGLLSPGSAITFEISGPRHAKLSIAAMLIPTNDTFFALDSVKLPRRGSKVYFAKAYDAGSEINDEYCVNIPGPACGGEGSSASDGEGYVHISAGIHGEGDLAVSTYDWRDAVAKIIIRRVQ